jgi:tRNA modification GTPase
MSGNCALTVADNVFRAACGARILGAQNRRMYYGEFVSCNGASFDSDMRAAACESGVNDGELIDLCFCMVSRAPSSYTGEDTVEFHCHGSPVVLAEVLQTLFSHGVRQALPGEFTKRAFLNGRMDLTQAEAVIDLIEAETPSAASNAVGRLRGAIGMKTGFVYNQLIDIAAHFHVVIDYPDEDIEDFEMYEYLTLLRDIEDELRYLLATHERGKILRGGIPTVIIGRPNTGKSSLLNALVGYERAIVTDIAGTTRDTIEEKLLIGNILLRLIDTAGLRKTGDLIENLGVERSLAALENASFVLLVLDGSELLTDADKDALRLIPPHVPVIAVVNKSDLPTVPEQGELDALGVSYCRVSALSGEGLDDLCAQIGNMFPVFANSPSGELVTNERQADAISRASHSINLAIAALTDAVTPDAVLTDIEAAIAAIGEVIGKSMHEDVVTRIFERFCVGK